MKEGEKEKEDMERENGKDDVIQKNDSEKRKKRGFNSGNKTRREEGERTEWRVKSVAGQL